MTDAARVSAAHGLKTIRVGAAQAATSHARVSPAAQRRGAPSAQAAGAGGVRGGVDGRAVVDAESLGAAGVEALGFPSLAKFETHLEKDGV